MLDRVAGTPSPTPAGDNPARLRQVAGDFEALLLAQLLKTMREERGWMGTGEDQAGTSMLEIAEEHLAQVLAAQGGLGLAELVAQSLEQAEAGQADSSS